ncbi:hypothetical protein V1520DRAFT_356293 [Lipomyces starkeyi]
MDELDEEVQHFLTGVTDEYTPEIATEELNRIIKSLLSDETSAGQNIRDVLRGRLWESDTEDKVQDTENNADPTADEAPPEIIDSLIRSPGLRVNRSWIPFHPVGQQAGRDRILTNTRASDARTKELTTLPTTTRDTELPDDYVDFQDVFADSNYSAGLPPHREGFDHAIELIPGKTPPNRTLYHQSEWELRITKEQIEDLLKRGV